jgi:hypothetical protein
MIIPENNFVHEKKGTLKRSFWMSDTLRTPLDPKDHQVIIILFLSEFYYVLGT